MKTILTTLAIVVAGTTVSANTYDGLGVFFTHNEAGARYFETVSECRNTYKMILRQAGGTGNSYWDEDSNAYIFTEQNLMCINLLDQ